MSKRKCRNCEETITWIEWILGERYCTYCIKAENRLINYEWQQMYLEEENKIEERYQKLKKKKK